MQVCGYFTDVEGNLDYFERYVAISQVWRSARGSLVPLAKLECTQRAGTGHDGARQCRHCMLSPSWPGAGARQGAPHSHLFVRQVLEWKDAEKTRLKFKRGDAMFVFGGDSQVAFPRPRTPSFVPPSHPLFTALRLLRTCIALTLDSAQFVPGYPEFIRRIRASATSDLLSCSLL
jgi:hypothetical protein